MRTYCVKLAMGAALALSLAGCTTPYSSPQIYSFDKPPATIRGISDLLNDHTMQLNSDHPEVDLIAMHGMCTHDGDWALESINALAKQLGEPPTPSKEDLTNLTVEDSNAIVYKRQLNIAAGTVNIAAVVWSPVLTPLKQQLCYDQKTKTGLCARGEKEKPDFLSKPLESPDFEETRALGNRLGKDTMLDDCLVDAVAYQGRAREEISRQVQKAVIAAAVPGSNERSTASLLVDATGRNTPLIMFTSSLGSKVGFDAIESLSNSSEKEKAAAKATMERLKTVFMSANQIPLLQLADQTLAEATSANLTQTAQAPSDSLSRLLYNPSLAPSSKPTIVFLSDPNDILSYSLRNAPLRPKYASIDVVVSNAWT
ncbi:hypothetical protein [Pseudomonas chlororaphis]|uniref:hypothetical protein n=1 Tax=Pseudomonas chlororaphis TaxID=587753 RepID=UPI00047094BF|nr:hypothetical protein [Pseudomonas chlororaphis]